MMVVEEEENKEREDIKKMRKNAHWPLSLRL